MPFTWVERKWNLFLTEFIFIWAKISLFESSLRNTFKALMQSFPCITLDTWDLHSSRRIFEISFSCQLRMWDSCLINVSSNSLNHFLFKWSLSLFEWWDLTFFVLSFQITSHPFWFKRELSVLNMILETPASFDSVFRDIAEFPIDSVTDFDDTCDNSLWPMFVVRLNDLVHLLSTVFYNRPYNEPLRRENFVHTLYNLLSFWTSPNYSGVLPCCHLIWHIIFLFPILCLVFRFFVILNYFSYFVDVYDHFQFSRSSHGFLLQHLYCLSHWQ